MDNSEYLYRLGVLNAQLHERCRAAMDAYGENKWWQEDIPPQILAYYQAHEPILLVDMTRFTTAISILIGNVWTHELVSPDFLPRIDAAYAAWEKLV